MPTKCPVSVFPRGANNNNYAHEKQNAQRKHNDLHRRQCLKMTVRKSLIKTLCCHSWNRTNALNQYERRIFQVAALYS